MEKTPNRKNDTDALQKQSNVELAPVNSLRTWPVVVTAVGLVACAVGGVGALVLASSAFTEAAAAATFLTGSTLNLLIFLAIIAQAFIYWAQRGMMVRQWDAMLGQLSEVKRQNDAFVSHERAYVGVDSGCIYGFAPKDTQSVQLIFINGGRTPAWKLWVEAKLSKEKLGAGDWTMIEPIGQPFVLMPGKTREVDWPKLALPLTQDEANAVIHKGLPLYLQGRFGFFDITGEMQTDDFILQIDSRDMSFTDAGHLAKSPFPNVPLDLGIKRHSKQDEK